MEIHIPLNMYLNISLLQARIFKMTTGTHMWRLQAFSRSVKTFVILFNKASYAIIRSLNPISIMNCE